MATVLYLDCCNRPVFTVLFTWTCVYAVFMVWLLSFLIWRKVILVGLTYVRGLSTALVCVLDPGTDSVASVRRWGVAGPPLSAWALFMPVKKF